MSTARPTSWTARLAWGALLLLVGAGLAIWGLAHWQAGARFLGVAPDAPPRLALFPQPAPAATPQAPAPDYAARLAGIEQRLAGVENATQAVAGSAGRADNLLIAFAARRAVERGAPLGYLEPLLIERFGARQQAAVTMVISRRSRRSATCPPNRPSASAGSPETRPRMPSMSGSPVMA